MDVPSGVGWVGFLHPCEPLHEGVELIRRAAIERVGFRSGGGIVIGGIIAHGDPKVLWVHGPV